MNYKDIATAIVGLALAPILGALLVPEIAEWFSQILRDHAAGMRALYPSLGLAAKAYRERRMPISQFELPAPCHCGSVEDADPEMSDLIHKSLLKR